MVVYKVNEIEYIIKIQVAPFLEALGTISARNLCITRERWVIRSRAVFHRVYRRILNKDSELWRKIWKSANCTQCLTIAGAFFWINLENSFELKETVVTGVYEVVEFECIIKIEVAPFLEALGTISARNLGITPERWAARARGRFHRVPRGILKRHR